MVATCVEKNQLIAVAAGCADGAGRASSIVLTYYLSLFKNQCMLLDEIVCQEKASIFLE